MAVWDNQGNTLGSQTITLLSLNLVSGGQVTSADLAPIVAFQLDFVDYLNAGNTTLSSGAGTITYAAANQMTVLSSEPNCVDWNYITLETANSVYGLLPSSPSTTFTQWFRADIALTQVMAAVGNDGQLQVFGLGLNDQFPYLIWQDPNGNWHWAGSLPPA